MEVTFFSFTKNSGGADRAAERMKYAVRDLGVKTKAVVIKSARPSSRDQVITPSKISELGHFVKWVLSYILTKFIMPRNDSKQSLNIFGSKFITENLKKAEICHIHWINNEMIKIKDFHLFSNKAVITLHDEWFYCGSEHHSFEPDHVGRVVDGYQKENKNVKLFDIPRLVWRLKVNYYKNMQNVIFTVPSKWLYDRAKNSYLLKDREIYIVPNPIDVDKFKKLPDELLNHNPENQEFNILFIMGRLKTSYTKGLDLFLAALESLKDVRRLQGKVKVLVCGEPFDVHRLPFKCKHLGYIKSNAELIKIYNQADVTIFPSRAEAFGQIASESLACETPVIAFKTSGVTDIVKDGENGFLAPSFEVKLLAEKILEAFDMPRDQLEKLGKNGRSHIVKHMSHKVVGEKLIKLYRSVDNYKKRSDQKSNYRYREI